MGKAARAIIFENGKILVMHRQKYGSEYFTLVGGRSNENETMEQTLVREVKEETGMQVVAAKLVYIEMHQSPYNEQYIYVCNVAPHEGIAVQDASEEGEMNRFEANVHKPYWVEVKAFSSMPFRTPQLQQAIVNGIKKGFPKEPVTL